MKMIQLLFLVTFYTLVFSYFLLKINFSELSTIEEQLHLKTYYIKKFCPLSYIIVR